MTQKKKKSNESWVGDDSRGGITNPPELGGSHSIVCCDPKKHQEESQSTEKQDARQLYCPRTDGSAKDYGYQNQLPK